MSNQATCGFYGKKSFASEAERVAFLFGRYQALVSLQPAEKPAKRRAKAANLRSNTLFIRLKFHVVRLGYRFDA